MRQDKEVNPNVIRALNRGEGKQYFVFSTGSFVPERRKFGKRFYERILSLWGPRTKWYDVSNSTHNREYKDIVKPIIMAPLPAIKKLRHPESPSRSHNPDRLLIHPRIQN